MIKKDIHNTEARTFSKNEAKASSSNKKISNLVVLYLMIGLVFAIVYMLNYHWPLTALLSPRFFSVVLTWPFQMIGLIRDVQIYGWGSKPLSF